MSRSAIDYTRQARARRDSRADVMAWQEYVALELVRFADHTGGNGKIWADTPRASRYVAARPAGSAEEYAYSGAWHIVRTHVTLEFRQWVEEYFGTDRLTLAQWVERDRLERAEVDRLDSADYTLDRLDEIRRGALMRDSLIVEAVRRGATVTDAARAAGISRQAAHGVLSRAAALEDAAAHVAPVTPITAAHGAHGAGAGVEGVELEPERGIEYVRTGTGDIVAVDVPF